MDTQSYELIKVTCESRVGLIQLNRPEVLNAQYAANGRGHGRWMCLRQPLRSVV